MRKPKSREGLPCSTNSDSSIGGTCLPQQTKLAALFNAVPAEPSGPLGLSATGLATPGTERASSNAGSQLQSPVTTAMLISLRLRLLPTLDVVLRLRYPN